MENTNYRYGQLRGGMTKEQREQLQDTRTVEFVISTEQRDRYGTVFQIDKWQLDNFNRAGIFGYQHDVYGAGMCEGPNPDSVLGPAEAFVEGRQLIGRGTFETEDINPLAEKIFKKVVNGTLKTSSVGAITQEGDYGKGTEARGGENETYYFGGQELLEWSIVNIPGNPGALKRTLRDNTYNALMFTHRALGGKFSFSDIEKMTVRNILDLIESRGTEVTPQVEEKINNHKVKIEKERMKLWTEYRV